MNKIILRIATLMMILLLVVLIWIFFEYYSENQVIDTISFSSGDSSNSTLGIPNEDYIPGAEQNPNYDNLIESIKNTSGNQNESNLLNNENNDGKKEEISNIGEVENVISGDNSNEVQSEDVILSKDKNEGQIIISSSSETSNEEKQEVLTEIDEALKGLLEAVGKVEIVDETRLDASLKSEVEVP